MSRRLILAAALAVSTAAFIAPSGPTPAHAPLRVVAFGSSSTQGIGATNPDATYPAQLQRALAKIVTDGREVDVVNRGIGGEDADDMIKRLKRDVIGRRPDVVVWQTGSNDPMRHVPIDRFERETREGVAAMQRAGIGVILMEPQWCPRLEMTGSVGAYRDVVRKVGRDMSVEVVRRTDLMHAWIRDGVITRRQMLAADGLHMTDGGYRLLARAVAPTVLKTEDGPALAAKP